MYTFRNKKVSLIDPKRQVLESGVSSLIMSGAMNRFLSENFEPNRTKQAERRFFSQIEDEKHSVHKPFPPTLTDRPQPVGLKMAWEQRSQDKLLVFAHGM